jgi:NADH:ubiquinone oxidoreductase subunit 4 (subunit M)
MNELILVFIILVISILCTLSFRNVSNKNAVNFSIKIHIILTLIIQLLGISLWLNFDPFLVVNEYNHGFQYFFNIPFNNNLGINLTFGIDGLSLLFILLTVFIFSLSTVFVLQLKRAHYTFLTVLLILEFILILVFTVLDIFIFYICFESSLIPMFVIIGV